MTIKEFVENYKAKKFMNIKTAAEEKSEWLRSELGIKTYIPFKEKRKIAEMIVEHNIRVEDGVKKYDDIDSYVSLVIASVKAHTNLKFSDDPVDDYDLLAESGLLTQIIAEFQGSHEEIGILLKMAVASELEDNNINVIIGHFLDGILNKLGELDFKKIFGEEIKEEDLAKLSGLLNKLK